MSEQERGGSEGGQDPLNLLRVLSNVLFGVLTSRVPSFFHKLMASTPHVQMCALFSGYTKWLHTPGPFPLSAHVLSALDPEFDPRPSFAMTLGGHCGSVAMSSSPKM